MFWRLVATLFLADKLNKLDQIHEAARRERLESARQARWEAECERRIAAESARRARESARQYARQEGARRYKRFADGKPFRIYHTNGIATVLYWIQGRKFFAEGYNDGRTRGYVVYEGMYDDMRLLTPAEFNAQYGRWVD